MNLLGHIQGLARGRIWLHVAGGYFTQTTSSIMGHSTQDTMTSRRSCWRQYRHSCIYVHRRVIAMHGISIDVLGSGCGLYIGENIMRCMREYNGHFAAKMITSQSSKIRVTTHILREERCCRCAQWECEAAESGTGYPW